MSSPSGQARGGKAKKQRFAQKAWTHWDFVRMIANPLCSLPLPVKMKLPPSAATKASALGQLACMAACTGGQTAAELYLVNHEPLLNTYVTTEIIPELPAVRRFKISLVHIVDHER